jgi:hypothetical protein
MTRPRPHVAGDKFAVRPAIWRIRHAERVAGDKSPRPVRICHTLRAGEDRRYATTEQVMDAQLGLIHRRQAAAVGVGRGALAYRLAAGSLAYVHPSVFITRHARLDETAQRYAALLHVGEDCVLSHSTAAAVWGLAKPRPELRATVVDRHVRDRPTLTVHRVALLDRRDVRLRDGLPVTAPARTLIDLAAETTSTGLADALAAVRLRRLADDGDLERAIDRAPLRTGVHALAELLSLPENQLVTRSLAERALIALLIEAGLPLPLTNVYVNGHEVDAYWPEHRLVLEIDSWQFHGTRRAFETDRRRDQDHLAAGDRTLRVTYAQIMEESLRTAAKITSALDAAL